MSWAAARTAGAGARRAGTATWARALGSGLGFGLVRCRDGRGATGRQVAPQQGCLPSSALSPPAWLAQGFFDSPAFPRLGSCASDVEDAYAEIKKAIDEIGTQTGF